MKEVTRCPNCGHHLSISANELTGYCPLCDRDVVVRSNIQMRAVNIDWDVDFEDELELLPKEVDIPYGMTDDDEISDYLSDLTGYCHKGFSLVEE